MSELSNDINMGPVSSGVGKKRRKSYERKTSSFKRGEKMRAENNGSRNITLIVIWTSIIYIFGATPYTLIFILSQFVDVYNIISYQPFLVVGELLLISSQGVFIFIYYFFNKLYKSIFNNYFSRLIRLISRR